MIARLALLRDAIRTSLWVVPMLAGIASFVLATGLVALDRALPADIEGPFVFDGGADSARGILTTISAAMLTFTGLVFSVTMLVLQLASSQLSPRVTRTFLRDRHTQLVLGLFVATFLYALFVLREVRSGEPGDEFVPGIATWTAFVLLLAAVAAFVLYIDHMAKSMRASSVIRSVADETREAIERLFPEEVGTAAEPLPPRLPEVSRTIDAGEGVGVVVAIDEARFLDLAREAGVVLELVPRVGDHVVGAGPLVRVRGPGAVAPEAVRDAIELGTERSITQDCRFGVRQLVDIALKALSPGINDPTTAVQVIDELHDLLRRLAGRRFPAPERADDGGPVRAVLPRPEYGEYVDLALSEIRLAGAGQLAVARRLSVLLDDLAAVVPEDRRPSVRHHRQLLDAGIEQAYPLSDDRRSAGARVDGS